MNESESDVHVLTVTQNATMEIIKVHSTSVDASAVPMLLRYFGLFALFFACLPLASKDPVASLVPSPLTHSLAFTLAFSP